MIAAQPAHAPGRTPADLRPPRRAAGDGKRLAGKVGEK